MVEPVIHILVISWVSIVMQYTWTWDIRFSKIKSGVLCLLSNPHYCHHSRQFLFPPAPSWRTHNSAVLWGLHSKCFTAGAHTCLKLQNRDLDQQWCSSCMKSLEHHQWRVLSRAWVFSHLIIQKRGVKQGQRPPTITNLSMFNIQVCHSDLTLRSIYT